MTAQKGIKLGGSLPFNTTGEIEFDSTSSIEEARQQIPSHNHYHSHDNNYAKKHHTHSTLEVIEETPRYLGTFILLVYMVIGIIVIMWFLAVTSHVWDELVELFQELLVLLGI